METLTWENSDLSGRRFVFEKDNLSAGTFTVLSEISSTARFYSGDDQITYYKNNFWEDTVFVKKNNQLIATITRQLFGRIYLNHNREKTFQLSFNFFGRNLKWLNQDGKPVVAYQMATLKSMRKGFVQIDASLSKDEKNVLLSAGLIANRLNTSRLIVSAGIIGWFVFSVINKFM